MAFWSPLFGFCETIICNKSVTELNPVYWPGGLQKVPKGWSSSNEEQPLKIGVPANGAFNQFVRMSYDLRRNETYISGFSVKVFEAVVNRLPYHLPYVLLPFYGSYDDMLEQIFYKGLDAAVGDIEIMADRYQYAEFSQPYVESGLVMIVLVKPDKSKKKNMALHENLYNKNVAANGGNALVRQICHLLFLDRVIISRSKALMKNQSEG
ncbi:hypothetical protein LWI29_000093 [Acer saccharum]|uniref:Solute-binding protein family 3/N-terminal domain-containing protein n=1 Tax=Acer saccharum TaxID=4024 RepID=A0AA39S4T3_ACESA|nr:hypothetical protein LWI29_000093 [Acer saccharum]